MMSFSYCLLWDSPLNNHITTDSVYNHTNQQPSLNWHPDKIKTYSFYSCTALNIISQLNISTWTGTSNLITEKLIIVTCMTYESSFIYIPHLSSTIVSGDGIIPAWSLGSICHFSLVFVCFDHTIYWSIFWSAHYFNLKPPMF